MIRRATVVVTLLVALAASATATAAPPAHPPDGRDVTRTVSRPVTASGRYVVLVYVRARMHDQLVTVYLSGASTRTVHASSRAATLLRYALTLAKAPSKVVARAVSPRPGVKLAMTVKATAVPHACASAGPCQPGADPGAPTPSPGAQYPNPYSNLVWSDDFSGAAGSAPNSSNWNVFSSGNGQCGNNTLNTNTNNSSNVELTGSNQLAITAQHSGSAVHLRRDRVTPDHLLPVRCRRGEHQLPPGQGLCPAFWMEGDGGGWPQAGEMDILEAPSFGSDANDALFDLHSAWSQTDPTDNYQSFEAQTTALGDLTTGFHTYAIIWSNNSIVWTIDGVEYAQATPSSLPSYAQWPFNNSESWSIVLDLAVGGWPCDGVGGCPGASFPAQMLVNWVRVYH